MSYVRICFERNASINEVQRTSENLRLLMTSSRCTETAQEIQRTGRKLKEPEGTSP